MTGAARAARSRACVGRACFVRASLAIASLGLAGCASLAPLSSSDGAGALSGRLAIKVDASDGAPARAFTAAFDLRGDAHTGALGLSTPLGSLLAQARWNPVAVTLTTPQGTRAYASLDELTHDALGESVPVAAWFDWLLGRPWPEAPSAPQVSSGGFAQLGWSVDVAHLADGAIRAVRTDPPPAVSVQIRVDR